MTRVEQLAYRPDPEVLHEYLRVRSLDDLVAQRRTDDLFAHLLDGYRGELRRLWHEYQQAKCIGLKYDLGIAIVGSSEQEVLRRAKEMFSGDGLDYLSSRRALFVPPLHLQ